MDPQATLPSATATTEISTLELQRIRADDIIKTYVIFSMTAGMVPSPLVDVVAVSALEIKMINDLAENFDFPIPSRLVVIKMLISLVGSAGTIYLATKMHTIVKSAPLIGHALYIGMLSISCGAAVYAVGKIFQKHFESGGKFLGGNDAEVESYFKEKYQEGKQRVPAYMAGA